MYMTDLLKEYKLNYTLDIIPNDLDKKDLIIYDLLNEGFNDSNSSKFREDATNYLSNREASEGKHGYDADNENVEIKPKNYTGKGKLNAGGQFTDFTWARDNKYSKDNVTMSVSGFVYGKLSFILEFPYNHLTFRNRIQNQLKRLLPNGDEKNKYVRSASFSFIHFEDANIKVIYVSPNIEKQKNTMTKKLYDFLKSKKGNIK
tara:strand:- start:81 stop:689 length:609 start_codon:yes stop_codon:yes gene_type:complete